MRNFEITIDQDPHGLSRMLISGFLSYDEARQYARQLYGDTHMSEMLRPCRSLIVSEPNLRLLGTAFSYKDYEVFFEKKLAPLPVSPIPLLDEPETIIKQADEEEEEEPADDEQTQGNDDDDLFNDAPASQQGGYMDFDDDFFK